MTQETDLPPEEQDIRSLHGKMAKGSAWTLFEKIGSHAISFVVFAVIARLVGPEEYGLVSLCYVYSSFASALLLSISDGVVSLHVKDTRRLSTLFWGTLACGLAISAACFALAGPFAALMGEARLVPLLRWFSLLPLLIALSTVPSSLIIAAMNFKVFALRTFVSTTVAGTVGIVLAFMNFGAYAIVAQQVVLFVVTNIVIWRCGAWRPRLQFSLEDLFRLMKPGINMSGHSLMTFVDQQAPRLLIGYFLGPLAVGHFAFITRIRMSLHEIIVYPLSDVSYPAFSLLKDKLEEKKKLLSRMVGLSGFLAFFAIGVIVATAPLFVPLFFGEKWAPAVPAFQIFLGTAAVTPLLTLFRNLLRASNKMGAYLKTQTAFSLLSIAAVFVLAPHGLVATSVGLLGLAFASVPFFTRVLFKRTRLSAWGDVFRLAAPLAAAFLLIVGLYVFDRSPYAPENKWLHLAVNLALGAAVYLAACFALQFRQMLSYWAYLKKLF